MKKLLLFAGGISIFSAVLFLLVLITPLAYGKTIDANECRQSNCDTKVLKTRCENYAKDKGYKAEQSFLSNVTDCNAKSGSCGCAADCMVHYPPFWSTLWYEIRGQSPTNERPRDIAKKLVDAPLAGNCTAPLLPPPLPPPPPPLTPGEECRISTCEIPAGFEADCKKGAGNFQISVEAGMCNSDCKCSVKCYAVDSTHKLLIGEPVPGKCVKPAKTGVKQQQSQVKIENPKASAYTYKFKNVEELRGASKKSLGSFSDGKLLKISVFEKYNYYSSITMTVSIVGNTVSVQVKDVNNNTLLQGTAVANGLFTPSTEFAPQESKTKSTVAPGNYQAPTGVSR